VSRPSHNPGQHRRRERTATLPLELPVGPARLRMKLRVPDGRWRLADVVPLARKLADALSAAALQDARRRGEQVSCRPGCCACCRYAAPLSPPEAFRLLEELRRLPPDRRGPLERGFQAAAARLAAAPAKADLLRNGRAHALPSPEAVGRWYRGLDLPCPLLSGGLCSLYAARPIACRMYFVTTPPALCAASGAGGRRLAMPVSIVTALCRLAAELEGRAAQAVLLPMAPAWARANAARSRRSWPAHDVARRFVRILHAAAQTVGIFAA